jgi:hypothetical protein
MTERAGDVTGVPGAGGATGVPAAGGLDGAPVAAGAGDVQGARGPWRAVAAVALLAGITIAWAAVPAGHASGWSWIALVAAAGCGAATLGRLLVGDAHIGGGAFDPLLVRLAAAVAHGLRALPWSEAMIVAVLVLEVLHPARPWHTGVLGVALLAFVLAAHLAETADAPRAALGPQGAVLAAGLGLAALAAAAVALPPLPAGPAATALRVIALAAAVAAGALALPAHRS